MDVKRPTYVGYEKKKDEIEVSEDTANAIAKFLNVEVKDLKSQEKVERPDLSGKYRIIEGENIILHKVAWDELHETLVNGRQALTDVIKNNTDLTQNNSRLTESITELVKNLLRPSGGNQHG
jgi:transcriptional regulator with XRE-family HTH domain